MSSSWEKQSLGVAPGSLPLSWGDHFSISCSHLSSFSNNRLTKTRQHIRLRGRKFFLTSQSQVKITC